MMRMTEAFLYSADLASQVLSRVPISNPYRLADTIAVRLHGFVSIPLKFEFGTSGSHFRIKYPNYEK